MLLGVSGGGSQGGCGRYCWGSGAQALLATVFVIDGLAQAAGAAMVIAGFAAPRRVLVRSDVARVRVVPAPLTFGKTSAGIGLRGSF